MFPREHFAHYKKNHRLVLSIHKYRGNCCLVTCYLVRNHITIKLYSQLLNNTWSETLLKTAYQFPLLLVGFDSLIERTMIDTLYFWVINQLKIPTVVTRATEQFLYDFRILVVVVAWRVSFLVGYYVTIMKPGEPPFKGNLHDVSWHAYLMVCRPGCIFRWWWWMDF